MQWTLSVNPIYVVDPTARTSDILEYLEQRCKQISGCALALENLLIANENHATLRAIGAMADECAQLAYVGLRLSGGEETNG
jgi:hypothetical protein